MYLEYMNIKVFTLLELIEARKLAFSSAGSEFEHKPSDPTVELMLSQLYVRIGNPPIGEEKLWDRLSKVCQGISIKLFEEYDLEKGWTLTDNLLSVPFSYHGEEDKIFGFYRVIAEIYSILGWPCQFVADGLETKRYQLVFLAFNEKTGREQLEKALEAKVNAWAMPAIIAIKQLIADGQHGFKLNEVGLADIPQQLASKVRDTIKKALKESGYIVESPLGISKYDYQVS